MDQLFHKFTSHSKNALKNAFSLALTLGHKAIAPQHILYGLSQEKGSIAAQILTKAKIENQEIKKNILADAAGQTAAGQISLAPGAKKILEKAFLIASLNQHKYIGTEHLLASLLAAKDDFVADYFRQRGVNLMNMRKQLDTILSGTSRFPNLNDINYLNPEDPAYATAAQPAAVQQSVLNLFGVKLTDKTIQEKIDPVIGREEEIDRLIQILSRRNKNNPLLLGEAGVGKTAIVEGLAKKIIQGEVPEILAKKNIYTLDLSLVVAGTSFRGEFENRLKQILNEIKKDPNLIIFIDEIHNLINAGSAIGSMDAANILKPALARGEIRLIGATTPDGYKKYIESDPALERRFQPVAVNQPSVEKTIAILTGIRQNYEFFHQVKITDEAITAAAELSHRYLVDRFLPDKAIDLIDEAASAVKIKCYNLPQFKEIRDQEDELAAVQTKKQQAVAGEKFDLALACQQKEQEILSQITALKTSQTQAKEKITAQIGSSEIAGLVAKMTGIPLAELVVTEKNRLLNLEKLLAKKIIAQEEALQTLAEFIRRSRAGITSANRPIGSFMFLGPTGVGKTETAKILAETIFGSPDALIKIDMSEFAESFNVSKLIGAPAGYIGYKDGAKLTDAVRRQPYSVVLFDEIEKAHPQVFNLFLQILEDGSLTDAAGKKINFKNTIIIMTSNLGSESFNQQAGLGFAEKSETETNRENNFLQTQQDVLKKLKEKFPPEFLNRLDKTIVFQPLDLAAIAKITELLLAELSERLAKQNILVEFEPKVALFIAKTSYTPDAGARAVRKTVQELIESKIANKILTAQNQTAEKMIVRVKNNKIII